jgi:hypothetical protein
VVAAATAAVDVAEDGLGLETVASRVLDMYVFFLLRFIINAYLVIILDYDIGY